MSDSMKNHLRITMLAGLFAVVPVVVTVCGIDLCRESDERPAHEADGQANSRGWAFCFAWW